MSKIKIKQIHSDGQPAGAVLSTDGNGNNVWVVPEVTSGSETYLGPAEDGSYTDPRIEGGRAPAVALEPTTKVSTAIDSINEILGLLLPTAPNALSTGALTLSTANTTQKAASGYTSNSVAGAPSAGSNVVRVTAATVDTAVLQDLGDGATGTIALWQDGVAVNGETLTFTGNIGDTKTTGLLRISDNKWSGVAVGGGSAPEGFFQSFDSQVVGATATVGFNTLQLRHSDSGNTNALGYVRDSLTANPAVSSIVLAETGTPTTTKISGVPHYTAGSQIAVSATATNLAGETYVGGTILGLTGPGTAVNFAAGQGGLPAVLAKDTLSFNMTTQTFTIGGNVLDRAQKINVAATNPNGSGNANSGTNLIVFSGSPSTGVKENAITGPGTTARVAYSYGGDTPPLQNISAWDSTVDLTTAGMTHEAAIVGGVIRNDLTNYSTGYLPVGPNYSGRLATQYIAFSIKAAAKSSVTITITGTYAGVWVALPGVSDNATKSPAALNGVWWNGMALYSGAGVPGRSGDTAAGCANGTLPAGTGTQTYTLTFGTESSSNATNNEILVRFKLTAGQAISAISFA